MSGKKTMDSLIPHAVPPQGEGRPQSVITDEVRQPTIEEDTKTYPCCDCPCTGPHSPNCMFHLYSQMTDNYQMTKDLAKQYLNQMTKDPMELELERRLEEVKREMYQQFCHQGTDISTVGLDKQKKYRRPSMPMPKSSQFGGGYGGQGMFGQGNMQTLLMGEGAVIGPESENRKLIEDQRKMKNLWVQFMNIFDMALDLADEASNARWMLNCQRKEDERLACKRRIEEANRDRLKRCLEQQACTENYQKDQQKKENKYDIKNDKSETNEKPETKQKSPKTSSQSSSKPSASAKKSDDEEKPRENEVNSKEPEPNEDEAKENVEDTEITPTESEPRGEEGEENTGNNGPEELPEN